VGRAAPKTTRKAVGFKKGNKLAKGGARPGSGRKPLVVKAKLRELAEQHGPKAYQVLAGIAFNKLAPFNERRQAAETLVAYWGGRPSQSIEVKGPKIDAAAKISEQALALIGKALE
jgi:hypothetical protein